MFKALPIGRLVSALVLVFLLQVDARADKRVALVIGNAAYQHVTRLENPRNDAKLMADTLRALNFTLVGGGPQTDLDKPAFDSLVQNFGRQLQGADVALFYYAGHGVQIRGANYLVPVAANPTREADVDFQMMDVNLVLRQMEGSGTKLNIVVLDACRNNPFGGRGLRATSAGLAQMQAPEGTIISYATQPGNVALDGTGANSPYTKALAETIRRPGLDILQAFNQVGLAVKRSTANAQQPWQSSSPIDGSFYFAGLGSGGGSVPPALPPADPCAAAQAHWTSAEAIGSIEALEDHAARFPACAFAGLARAKIAELRRLEAKDRDDRKTIAALTPPTAKDPALDNTLLIDTKHGQIVIKLRNDLAPSHVGRIKTLAREKFYDNVPFHRVIAGFMAQTGDGKNGDGTGNSKYPNLIAEFSSVPFKRGIVGMARAASNDSANSQFFIMFADGAFLNGKYTVIGEVVSGMDVVDKLKKAPSGAGGGVVPDPDRMIRVQVAADVKP